MYDMYFCNLVLKCCRIALGRPKNGKVAALYLRTRKKPTEDKWYSDVRIGINTSSKVVRKLCDKAEFEGFYNNNSLRATAAIRMYNADIPEQLICGGNGSSF